jgi:hypothetical protein
MQNEVSHEGGYFEDMILKASEDPSPPSLRDPWEPTNNSHRKVSDIVRSLRM